MRGPDADTPADAVSLTRALVRTPSVNPLLSPSGTGERGMADLVSRWLRDWGLDVDTVEVAPARFNVVSRIPGSGGGPTLLLNGHLDTVGVEGMAGDPWSGDVRDGRLYGRGACDMKAGVGAILETARRLSGADLRGELVLAFTADEEHASLGMQSLLESGVEADMAVVCEPTSLAVMPANKGFVWAEVFFRGRAAHGSRPEEGRDAIRDCAAFLSLLDRVEDRIAQRSPHPLLSRGSIHAGTIRGGTAPSVYPEECSVVLERRTLPGEAPGDFVRELEWVVSLAGEARPGIQARIVPGLARPATEVPDSHPLVRGLGRALEAEGLPDRVEGMTAWVDAALLNEAGIPAVCFGPGSIAQAHASEEWVEVREIEAAASVLERFARSLLHGSPERR